MVKEIDNVILIAMLTIIRTVDPIYCQAEEIQFLQFLLIQIFSSESILAEERNQWQKLGGSGERI